MNAYISSIKYIKTNKYEGYLLVSLEDEIGNKIGTFGSDKFTSPVEFRKEMFGIMASTSCFDLLKLGFNLPNKLEVTIELDEFDRIQKIKNSNGISFFKNENYFYETKRSLKDLLFKNNNLEKWTIENIKSQSNVFSILLMNKSTGISLTTGSVYYGFGYPLLTCKEPKPEDIYRSSLEYLTFIKSILNLYGTDDLMMLSRTSKMRQNVQIILDKKDNIIGIGNKEKDIYLITKDNTYQLVNNKMLQESTLKLRK